MGTTLTSMQTGSGRYQLVATIYGYPWLLTDGDAAAAVTAYSGTDWSQARGGLRVQIRNISSINPWKSLPQGGSCVLRVVDADANDGFGVDTHKMATGFETVLTSTLDRDDTTVNVKSTSGATVPGDFYIGNECVTASASTATTFTVTRGKYSPFTTFGGSRFTEDHRAGTVDYAINIEPTVSQYRRIWTGAWVAVRCHRVAPDGTLDVVAESQLLFAGTIEQITDDQENGETVVSCTSLLDRVRNAVLMKEQYKARLKPQIYLNAGNVMKATDFAGTPPSKTMTDFTFTAGYYTAQELCSAMNAHLADQKNATNLYGNHVFTLEAGTSDVRCKLTTQFSGGSGAVAAAIAIPRPVAIYLGFAPASTSGQPSYVISQNGSGTSAIEKRGDEPVKALFLGYDQGTSPNLSIYQQSGTPVDQGSYLPPKFGNITTFLGPPDCILRLDDGTEFVAFVDTGSEQIEVYPQSVDYSHFDINLPPSFPQYVAECKQVIEVSDKAKNLIPYFFFSTGTGGFNHSTYDIAGGANSLGQQIGLGIPGELLPQAFIDSLIYSTLGDVTLTIPIDKPTKFSELLDVNLVMLGLYLVWKNKGLRFVEWQQPLAANATLALTESNKAKKSGDNAPQWAPTTLTLEWAKAIVKMELDYDQATNQFMRFPWFVDRVAVDEQGGGAEPVTLSSKAISGADDDLIVAYFKTRLGFFTRGVHKTTRSLSPAQIEGYSAGEVVTVTDTTARDPETGRRGITARAGLMVRHTYDLSYEKGEIRIAAECDVIMPLINRAAAWSPCAEVDDTAANAGYNAGAKTLTCYAHEHSESTETADAARFPAQSDVVVVEVDPSNTAAPLSWTDSVASQSGNTITLVTGLAGWDTTKKYRVISADYSTVEGSANTWQLADAYQADDADALVQNERAAYQWQLGASSTYTSETTSKRAERIPDLAYGDGKPLDTGHERSIVRIINQGIDYKTSHQSPVLDNTARAGAGSGSVRRLTFIEPIWLSPFSHGYVNRVLSVAPRMRSSDGSAVSVYVTLCVQMPTGSSRDNIALPSPSVSATFTTSSTTWATATAQDLDISPIGAGGWGYVLIELSDKAECRGLGKCTEGVRT